MTDLQALIGLRKGDRSYEQLSKACGGNPSAKRLHSIATAPIKNFPDPDTIRALSKGLGVTEMTVILAAAESLDLDVRSPSSWAAFMPAGVDEIPAHMRDGILSVINSAVRMTKDATPDSAVDEPQDEEAPTAGGTLHELRPSAEPRRVKTAARKRPKPDEGDES